MTIYLKPKSHPDHHYTKIAETTHETIKQSLPPTVTQNKNYENWLHHHHNIPTLTHNLQHHIAYIALIEYKTVGTIILNPTTGEITTFYIAKQHQNKGIGKTLLRKIITPENLQHVNTQTIHITTHNHKLNNLLQPHQFQTTPTTNTWFPDIEHNTHSLQI